MSLPTGNPRIPEGINARDEHPLKEFLILAGGVTAALLAAILLLSLAARWLAPYIPFSWELQAAPPIESLLGGESDDGDAQARAELQQLAQHLVRTSMGIDIGTDAAADSVPAEHFKFILLPMDTPNAFATLGANVAVTGALLEHVESENGLAMVLAHEIAHVQLRHPIEAAGRGVVIQVALATVLGSSGSNLLGSSLSTGGLLTMLSFNRDMELAADERALAILKAHYGHTSGADEFFAALEQQQDSEDWLEFTRTHPNTDRRLALIRGAMARDTIPGNTRPLPPALLRGK